MDGYEGSRKLARRGDVQLAFCWSHVRRRFVELARAGPTPIASEALERIAALYQIETEIRGRSPAERRTVRQARSRSVALVADQATPDQIAAIRARLGLDLPLVQQFCVWLTQILRGDSAPRSSPTDPSSRSTWSGTGFATCCTPASRASFER